MNSNNENIKYGGAINYNSPLLIKKNIRLDGNKLIAKIWTIFQVIIIGITSYYLLMEASNFYAQHDDGNFPPFLKALIIESILIFLAIERPRTIVSKILVKCSLVLLFLFSTWIFCSALYNDSMLNIRDNIFQKESITSFSTQLNEKRKLRDQWASKSYVGNVRRIEKQINVLHSKIELAKSKLVKMGDKDTIYYNLVLLIIFRILIQSSNLYFFHKLFDQFKIVPIST